MSTTQEGVHLNHEKIIEAIKSNGKYSQSDILIKKWEADETESTKLIGDIKKQSLPFLGVLNGFLERDGLAVQSYRNGDKYFGYFDENQKEKHGLYMFNPKVDGAKLCSEFYYGVWKDDQINDHGSYMWLTEDKNKKPFSDFDASSFDLFVGKVKDGHFDEGTYLSKKEDDYYVYHGKFDKDGKQTTDKGFLYSATYEQLMFGKFSKNAFVSGFIAIFDEDGNVKDLAKYDGRKTIGMEEINEEEKNKTCQIMTHFRNVILQKDYFGDAYNQYAKIKEFLGKEMKDIDIFNSDKYMDIFGITAAHNKIKIYEDITKLVQY